MRKSHILKKNGGDTSVATFAELRKQKGFTQIQLAKSLGIDQSTVSLWEKGKTAPRVDTALRLAEIMGCTVDDIFRAIRAASISSAPIS